MTVLLIVSFMIGGDATHELENGGFSLQTQHVESCKKHGASLLESFSKFPRFESGQLSINQELHCSA